jgi:hypothetical protein
MVSKILVEEAQDYTGPDKRSLTGRLYRVEPKLPNRYFDQYTVKTTESGIVYRIQGRYESPEKENLCQRTKHLAGLLEDKYGKPRGKGMLSDWYTFREKTEGPYRGVKLYAPKCRYGRYTIDYLDEGAKTILSQPGPEPTETDGL